MTGPVNEQFFTELADDLKGLTERLRRAATFAEVDCEWSILATFRTAETEARDYARYFETFLATQARIAEAKRSVDTARRRVGRPRKQVAG